MLCRVDNAQQTLERAVFSLELRNKRAHQPLLLIHKYSPLSVSEEFTFHLSDTEVDGLICCGQWDVK